MNTTQLPLTILICLVFTLLGFDIGQDKAHTKIADECTRLGEITVNQDVFECKRKETSP